MKCCANCDYYDWQYSEKKCGCEWCYCHSDIIACMKCVFNPDKEKFIEDPSECCDNWKQE